MEPQKTESVEPDKCVPNRPLLYMQWILFQPQKVLTTTVISFVSLARIWENELHKVQKHRLGMNAEHNSLHASRKVMHKTTIISKSSDNFMNVSIPNIPSAHQK